MKKIYALLVGINKYHPKSGVSSLEGCESDVKHFKEFLEKTYSKEQLVIKTLIGKEASYENIIKYFGEKHLLKAEKGDAVLFHFSGHGAREGAALQFARYFPEGKQETLVCYDSRLKGHFDLADKELGILVDRIAIKDVHTVVVLDSCHSGSGTRDINGFKLGKSRQWDDREDIRAIETYLDGFLVGKENFTPTGKHILLAACDKKEKAFELRNTKRGNFTSNLLKVLKETKGEISYADLFTRTRILMHRLSTDQNPQFETYGYFNSFSGFLGASGHDQSVPGKISYSPISKSWGINLGAVHGLPNDGKVQPKFEIFDGKKYLGTAHSTTVGLKESTVVADGEVKLDELTIYNAKLLSMKQGRIPVYVTGVKRRSKKIMKVAENDFHPIRFELNASASGALYELQVSTDSLIVLRASDRMVLRTANGDDDEKAFKDIFRFLEHLNKWEHSLAIQNKTTKFDRSAVKMTIVELGSDNEPVRRISDPETIIDILVEGGKQKKVPFYVEAENTSDEDLNCALYYYSGKYEIRNMYNGVLPKNSTTVLLEWIKKDKRYQFTLDKGLVNATDIFKIIVSRKALEPAMLELPKLVLGETKNYPKFKDIGVKGIGDEEDEETPVEERDPNDWYTQTIKVRSIKREAQIGTEDLSLNSNKIKISSHKKLRANVSLEQSQLGTRGIEQTSVITQLAMKGGIEVMDFAPRGARTSGAPNILVLNDLKGDDGLNDENPLEIEIDAGLKKNELLLPFTFDGKHIIAVGQSERTASGAAKISIAELPETQEEIRRRSLGKALKLVFLKVIGRKNTTKLTWVNYNDEESVREKKGVTEKVAEATNILIVIHGIIGDTSAQAESMRLLYESEKVDLVLAFDYENLNTPIEKTADLFKTALADVGIKEGSGKNVTILAHSMGGLVSRYFIERLEGNKIINHLIMAGTPNNGSAFSKVADYVNYGTIVLGLGINLGMGFPGLAGIYGMLKGSKKLFFTLKQMAVEGDFIKLLNQGNEPGIKYSIIGGNLYEFLEKGDNAKQWMNVILKSGADLFYGKETDNDIAVATDSILTVSKNSNLTVERKACHHMNYFVEEEPLKVLHSWV